jgi:hypothetical protein
VQREQVRLQLGVLDKAKKASDMSGMFYPPHPGEVLADTVLGNGGINVTEFARLLGMTRTRGSIAPLSSASSGAISLPNSVAHNRDNSALMSIPCAVFLWRPQTPRYQPILSLKRVGA